VGVHGVAIIAVPRQTVSLVRIPDGVVRDVDSLLVVVVATAVFVGEAVRVSRRHARELLILRGEIAPVGDVPGEVRTGDGRNLVV